MKLIKSLFLKGNKIQKSGVFLAVAEEYFLLECWNQYSYLPEFLLPHVDTIKTRQEWESIGLELQANKYGQIRKIQIENIFYSLLRVKADQENEVAAIKTGKKVTQNPEHINLLLDRGCKPEEFLCLALGKAI